MPGIKIGYSHHSQRESKTNEGYFINKLSILNIRYYAQKILRRFKFGFNRRHR